MGVGRELAAGVCVCVWVYGSGCLVGTPRRNHSHRAPKEHKIPTTNYASYHGMVTALMAQRRRRPSPRSVVHIPTIPNLTARLA